MRLKRSEADIARVVMDAMQEQGWDCYPEVLLPLGGRADIVGVRPFPFLPHRKCVHIVECKSSWSLSLLEQAEQRLAQAHYVSIAAPTRYSPFVKRLCRERGIGMICVHTYSANFIEPYHHLEPRLSRHRGRGKMSGPERVIASLHEDMKRYAPGSPSSAGYSTPFRRTMDRCEEFVRQNPGCTVKEIAESVPHHYASIGGFKQGILAWLAKREGTEARKEGKCFRFYPVGSPPKHEPAPDCPSA